MPRKKKSVTPEQDAEPKPKKARPVNEVYLVAVLITDEMHPDERIRQSVLLRNIKEMNGLCKPKNGAKAYHFMDVLECWRNLRSSESVAGFVIEDAKVSTVLKGNPIYIERWTEWMLDLPPVYDAYSHDCAVKTRADFLRRHGFRYGATGLPNRLSAETVQELGL